jgi:hypothetical protein
VGPTRAPYEQILREAGRHGCVLDAPPSITSLVLRPLAAVPTAPPLRRKRLRALAPSSCPVRTKRSIGRGDPADFCFRQGKGDSAAHSDRATESRPKRARVDAGSRRSFQRSGSAASDAGGCGAAPCSVPSHLLVHAQGRFSQLEPLPGHFRVGMCIPPDRAARHYPLGRQAPTRRERRVRERVAASARGAPVRG